LGKVTKLIFEISIISLAGCLAVVGHLSYLNTFLFSAIQTS